MFTALYHSIFMTDGSSGLRETEPIAYHISALTLIDYYRRFRKRGTSFFHSFLERLILCVCVRACKCLFAPV